MRHLLHVAELGLRIPRLALHIPETFLHDFRLGLFYGYPMCCVTQFSVERALSKVKGRERSQALERGGVRLPNGEAFVPCCYHEGVHPHWYPFKPWQKLMMADHRERQHS